MTWCPACNTAPCKLRGNEESMTWCPACNTDPCKFKHPSADEWRKMVTKMPQAFDLKLDYYLAGPMTGIEDYNYPYFEKCANELRESGVKIHSPHETPWPEDHDKLPIEELWHYMMIDTNKLVSMSQGIILLKGWPRSRGALIELSKFTERGAPVYYYHDFVLTDMNRWE